MPNGCITGRHGRHSHFSQQILKECLSLPTEQNPTAFTHLIAAGFPISRFESPSVPDIRVLEFPKVYPVRSESPALA